MELVELDNEALVEMYKESNDEIILQQLMDKNIGIIKIIANNYVRSIPNSELEDLVSESFIAMLDTIRDFDVKRGYSFTTLLKTYITQRLNKIYYKETRKKRYSGAMMYSYEGLIETSRGRTDVNAVECKDISFVEFENVLSSMNFNDKERIVVNILMSGGSKGDVAKYLNITPPSVTYYVRSIAKKLELSGTYN